MSVVTLAAAVDAAPRFPRRSSRDEVGRVPGAARRLAELAVPCDRRPRSRFPHLMGETSRPDVGVIAVDALLAPGRLALGWRLRLAMKPRCQVCGATVPVLAHPVRQE